MTIFLLLLLLLLALPPGSCAAAAHDLDLPAVDAVVLRGGFGAGWQRDAPSAEIAVAGLLERLGFNPTDFVLDANLTRNAKGMDTMQLSSTAGGKVVVRGSSGVALASAVNWYLNDFCYTTYDWNTYAAQLPAKLPLPPTTTPVRGRTVPWSYYMNVCTYGYSLAFVDWQYWEKHIDWMALNGINLPLAFIGQEWLWQDIFKGSYGIEPEDLADFFSGPAFLPWFRMGNMRGWAGAAMSPNGMQTWLRGRSELQKQILARMRSFEMTPVLSAFAGHVPKAFIDKHPTASFTRSSDWGGFDPGKYGEVYMLDPTDPLFLELGNKFISKQANDWGTDHIYNCDTYNEMDPANNTAAFLQSSARAVYGAMSGADPDAIWLMQGWLFKHQKFWGPTQIEAYLTAVPTKKQWILDLAAESDPFWSKTHSFYGKPFIWCTLLVFGGQQGYYGNMNSVWAGTDAAINGNSSVVGVGITMEGIWVNYPVFEATLMLGWEQQPGWGVSDYFDSFGTRRYGQATSGGKATWDTIGREVYGSEPAAQAPRWNAGREGLIERLPMLLDAADGTAAADTDGIMPPGSTAGGDARCTYAGPAARQFLYRYAPGYTPGSNVYDETSLKAAQSWCCTQGPSCGGITEVVKAGKYQARASCTPKARPSGPAAGETSWYKATCATPDPGPPNPRPPSPPPPPPQRQSFADVWRALLSESETLGHVPSYRYDLVDIGREQIEFNFSVYNDNFQAACKGADAAAAKAAGATLLGTIRDFDAILSTDPNFMLGPWISWARGWSNVTKEQDWLEFNARNQITLWGPHGNINDYAARSWGGLVSNYYLKRWEMFVADMLAASFGAGPKFDQAAFNSKVMETIGKPWSNATSPAFPTTAQGDTVVLSRLLFAKYVGV